MPLSPAPGSLEAVVEDLLECPIKGENCGISHLDFTLLLSYIQCTYPSLIHDRFRTRKPINFIFSFTTHVPITSIPSFYVTLYLPFFLLCMLFRSHTCMFTCIHIGSISSITSYLHLFLGEKDNPEKQSITHFTSFFQVTLNYTWLFK